MSAGGTIVLPHEPKIVVVHAIERLAPKMQDAVRAALAEMDREGLEAELYETERLHETAVTYYKRGRPPSTEYPKPVTNAPDETYSWHGYRLAGDIIHRRLRWGPGRAWFEKMATIAKRHDLKCGIGWKQEDEPHVQWALCRASPSDEARRILKADGVEAVWRAVQAA